jgi:hypothetical protein
VAKKKFNQMRRGGKKLSEISAIFCPFFSFFRTFFAIFSTFSTTFDRFQPFQNTNLRVWCYPKLPIFPILPATNDPCPPLAEATND